jgi:polar amino acid transport system substrate-binding protein
LTDPRQAIHVSTHHDAASNCVVITVRDEGAGITPENLPQIQDPFFTTRHDSGGTGLGLPISSRIVEEHGGTMSFESEVGVGTSVTVGLPVLAPRCGSTEVSR